MLVDRCMRDLKFIFTSFKTSSETLSIVERWSKTKELRQVCSLTCTPNHPLGPGLFDDALGLLLAGNFFQAAHQHVACAGLTLGGSQDGFRLIRVPDHACEVVRASACQKQRGQVQGYLTRPAKEQNAWHDWVSFFEGALLSEMNMGRERRKRSERNERKNREERDDGGFELGEQGYNTYSARPGTGFRIP